MNKKHLRKTNNQLGSGALTRTKPVIKSTMPAGLLPLSAAEESLSSTESIVGRLLFVENNPDQMQAAKAELEAAGWQTHLVRAPDEAQKLLERNQDTLPDVISVDLGLLEKKEDPEYGLKLLHDIRERWSPSALPLVVHSAISGTKFNERLVRKVAASGASYFWLRDEAHVRAYVLMMPFIAQGYIVYSPSPAGMLQRVLSASPPPFVNNSTLVQTLKFLNEGKTFEQIGKLEKHGDKAIQARVKKMAETLELLGEIGPLEESQSTAPYRNALVKWYLKNSYRFPDD